MVARSKLNTTTQPDNDLDGTYIYYAKPAAANEAGGNYSAAEALWLKAMRAARKEVNREWADRRAAMCKQLATKWR